MKIVFYIFLFSFLFSKFASAQINKPLAEIGQSNYLSGNFQEAAKNFNSAFDQSPNDASLAYNLANSQYRLGQFDQALQSFNQAAVITQDSKLKQKAYYNAGNASFNLGKLKQAINSYKKALELDPNDMDAKYNLELSQKQLKKRQQNQQQDNQQKKSSDKDSKDSKKNSNKSDSQENQESAKDSKKDQEHDSQPNQNEDNSESKTSKNQPLEKPQENYENNQNPKNEEQGSQSIAGNPQQEELTKEQAEQWLLSINENRKKFGQMQAKKLKPNSEYRGKDW